MWAGACVCSWVDFFSIYTTFDGVCVCVNILSHQQKQFNTLQRNMFFTLASWLKHFCKGNNSMDNNAKAHACNWIEINDTVGWKIAQANVHPIKWLRKCCRRRLHRRRICCSCCCCRRCYKVCAHNDCEMRNCSIHIDSFRWFISADENVFFLQRRVWKRTRKAQRISRICWSVTIMMEWCANISVKIEFPSRFMASPSVTTHTQREREPNLKTDRSRMFFKMCWNVEI